MPPSGLATMPDATTGPGIRPGTMADMVSTVAGMILGIITIPYSMAVGDIMATMAGIRLGAMAGMILGMVPGDLTLGTTTVIIPSMLLVVAVIIAQPRPSVPVPSAETALITLATGEEHLPVMPAA